MLYKMEKINYFKFYKHDGQKDERKNTGGFSIVSLKKKTCYSFRNIEFSEKNIHILFIKG